MSMVAFGMKGSQPWNRPGAHRRGFTLVEVMIVLFLLVVAVGGLSASVISAFRLGESNDETARADEAAQSIVAQLRTAAFSEIFATYNSDDTDDPDGKGTGEGDDFDVPGLVPDCEDSDGQVGQLLFPTVAGDAATVLREDAVDEALGFPRDLNGDGDVDKLDHSGDYVVLPVTVRLTWDSAGGKRTHEVHVLLME
jgi:prepilin-type N-terminal cleavage/methylation domain-containing protein